MKTFKTLLLLLVTIPSINMSLIAQSADEIINNYFENTGGIDNWSSLNSLKMNASVNQGVDIPVEIYQMKDGRQAVIVNFQGQEITQFAFDGETMWSTNFMTMQAEKSDSEMTANFKKQSLDFPSALFNYKDKGYTVELMQNETIDGAETFKIKLTQKPIMVDGKELPNISYHYFDTDSFALIQSEAEIQQGPMAGQKSISKMSDYQEVDGLYFPFDMSMGGQSIKILSIELNPEIENKVFAFPEE
ncbi:MAG: outer membrane lipoprotein-sorting protein [Flavobacteriaceae bacterium]|nr:outer membrane lipoprotein-sorting protein [Flavobacteriaceae bacterium]